MRFGFERLERRELLSFRVAIDIEGPHIAFAGDEVSYAVTMTSWDLTQDPLIASARVSVPLDDVAWKLDGSPWSAADGTIAFEPQKSRVLTATGHVPNDVTHFQLTVAMRIGDSGLTALIPHSTVALDQFVNSDSVGAAVNWYHEDGRGVVDYNYEDTFFHNFGETREPPITAVPEPASLGLLSLAVLGLVGMRGRHRGHEGRSFVTLTAALLGSTVCLATEVDHTVHRPGIGRFETPQGSFIEVNDTADGYKIEQFVSAHDADNGFLGNHRAVDFRASFHQDGWVSITFEEFRFSDGGGFDMDFAPYRDRDMGINITPGVSFILAPTDIVAEAFPDSDHTIIVNWVGCGDSRCHNATAHFEYSVVPIEAPLSADFNFDDKVDFSDFLILSSN